MCLISLVSSFQHFFPFVITSKIGAKKAMGHHHAGTLHEHNKIYIFAENDNGGHHHHHFLVTKEGKKGNMCKSISLVRFNRQVEVKWVTEWMTWTHPISWKKFQSGAFDIAFQEKMSLSFSSQEWMVFGYYFTTAKKYVCVHKYTNFPKRRKWWWQLWLQNCPLAGPWSLPCFIRLA